MPAQESKQKLHYIAASLGLLVFVALQILVTTHHEPWSDEVQARLIVTETSPWDLLVHRMRYESSPGLWHLWLWLWAKLIPGLLSLKVAALLLSTITAALIFFRSPFPKPERYFIPFSYFLVYQYAIVARNYCLTALGMVCAAIFFKQRFQRPWPYVLSLLAVAHTCSHGILMASGIAFGDLVTLRKSNFVQRTPLLKLTPVFAVGVLLALAQIVPKPEDFYLQNIYQNPPSLHSTLTYLSAALVDNIPLSLVLLGLSFAIFFKNSVHWHGAFAMGLLMALYYFVHSRVQHIGLLFLVLLFCYWASVEQELEKGKLQNLTRLVFGVILVFQIYAGVQVSRNEINHPCSGLEAISLHLQEIGVKPSQCVIYGFHERMISAYFRRDLSKPTYLWVVDQSGSYTSPANPLYVVSYVTNKMETEQTKAQAAAKGLEFVQEFPGKQLFKTGLSQHATYLLFRVPTKPPAE